MTAPTPAVRRLATELERRVWEVDLYDNIARDGLTAALTDPDDPDFLARTLFVLHYGTERFAPIGESADLREEALREWSNRLGINHRREHWRAVADGLRMMLTGSGS